MKVTVDIPVSQALRLRNVVELLKTGHPSVAELAAQLEKHGLDLSQIRLT